MFVHPLELDPRVSYETVRRVMRSDGLNYRHARKKGVLTKIDLKLMLQFARMVKRKLSPMFFGRKTFRSTLMRSVLPQRLIRLIKRVPQKQWPGGDLKTV